MSQIIELKDKIIKIDSENRCRLLVKKEKGWELLKDFTQQGNELYEIGCNENFIVISGTRGRFISKDLGLSWRKFFDYRDLHYTESSLYLDDIRPIPAGFDGARNYDDFIGFLMKNGLPSLISFDHDLGEGKTGFDCAKFLVDYCLDKGLKLSAWKVHSQNPVGKENIEKLLEGFEKFQMQNI